MSLHPRVPGEVPAQTEQIARQAFPKGCLCMRLRDVLGPLFADQDFLDLFPRRGRPAWPPHQLAIVSVLQFLENLSDRQAAAAVRARIDWKYLLGLELTDPGFDHSVLSEFRDRQLTGANLEHLLDVMLDRMREQGLLKRPGRQRTDSTHVLAAIRRLNRLENVAEHLRAALNAIATIEPHWLAAWVPSTWFDRYARRIEDFRLPQDKVDRIAYAEQTGHDGRTLLQALYHADTPRKLRDLPAVQALRITWIHQFVTDDDRMHLRDAKDLPPSRQRNASPYDDQARHSLKRSIGWTGYKAHYSETCDADAPHLITHVATTDATVTDVEMTATIQSALAQADLAPREHLVDTGYINAQLLTADAGATELIGPIRPDVSWQAKAGQGFSLDDFTIDWDAQHATCPQDHRSIRWKPHRGRAGHPAIHIDFDQRHCTPCPVRAQCTRSATSARALTLSTREEHETIRRARQAQTTAAWQQRYQQRAGVEAVLSQALRRCGLRRSRYIGQDKTHLQHVLTAAAINLIRIDAWLAGVPLAKTRVSAFGRLRPR
ncbi:IS1182 family transposase [Nonomuraea fuscirosea]|uniref:IS1182 family transposase n=1 Tax=Nonomuraea fuscirosea TaxID=1291556 RepID=UPI00341892A4